MSDGITTAYYRLFDLNDPKLTFYVVKSQLVRDPHHCQVYVQELSPSSANIMDATSSEREQLLAAIIQDKAEVITKQQFNDVRISYIKEEQ